MPAADSVRFNNGDIVQRVTQKDDPELGVIVGVIYRPHNGVEYFAAWPSCTDETKHYETELMLVEEFVDRKKR